MGDGTGIEWTDATWNPIVGCSIVSPGCTNCYAMKMAARIEAMQDSAVRAGKVVQAEHYAGTTKWVNGNAVWTGQLALASDRVLTQPLRWKRPRRIFVNSMGDLFHEGVPDEWISSVFAVMAQCPQHTFQVLTKRSSNMCRVVGDPAFANDVFATLRIIDNPDQRPFEWPLQNVWLGVSAEDQTRADQRIPDLLATPAAVRFVSAEPLLGAIDFRPCWLREMTICGDCPSADDGADIECKSDDPRLDWVIVGGESGPGARPMHPDWARSLRDRCAAARVPFFFKQWGEWTPGECVPADVTGIVESATLEDFQTGRWHFARERIDMDGGHADDEPDVWRVGKRRAGRMLDGCTHDGMPAVAQRIKEPAA